jgi:hypothetical protein
VRACDWGVRPVATAGSETALRPGLDLPIAGPSESRCPQPPRVEPVQKRRPRSASFARKMPFRRWRQARSRDDRSQYGLDGTELGPPNPPSATRVGRPTTASLEALAPDSTGTSTEDSSHTRTARALTIAGRAIWSAKSHARRTRLP